MDRHVQTWTYGGHNTDKPFHSSNYMIFIDRRNRTLPANLRSDLKAAYERARKFFAADPSTRSQERFSFETKVLEDTLEYLNRLFQFKCAYCERNAYENAPRELTGDRSRAPVMAVDHFRPKIEAKQLDGSSSPDWYWWLAYEWSNLYLACGFCSLNKGNLFPVARERCPINKIGTDLMSEEALLLDPCIDRPEQYLYFASDGTIRSRAHAAQPQSGQVDRYDPRYDNRYDRGAVTIEILDLNHHRLVQARLQIIKTLNTTFDILLEDIRNNYLAGINNGLEALNQFIDPDQEFVGLRRQRLGQKLSEFDEDLKALAPEKSLLLRTIRKQVPLIQPDTPKPDSPPSSTHVSRYEISYDTAYVQSVEIQNFRAIRKLKLNFNVHTNVPVRSNRGLSEPAGKDVVGWKVLLGENGTGKSSVLKAIALALIGSTEVNANIDRFGLDTSRILRRNSKSGFIKVELTKGEPIVISFDSSGIKFGEARSEGANVFVRAYGSARLYDNDTGHQLRKSKNVANLFRPHELLNNPREWLLNASSVELGRAGRTIKDILEIYDTKSPLSIHDGQVYLDIGNGRILLEDQSDGYKSILAIASDIMNGLPNTSADAHSTAGIVLIDEIDAHLHPRWKMRIVKQLRQAFPGIQFIVSTHEPLCLKGLGNREITVMHRSEDGVSANDDIDYPVELRADQLLTSELFGLNSTIDPDIDQAFQEYYGLLQKDPERLSHEEHTRLKTLESELSAFNQLGFTRRDRLVYEIIDRHIAKEMLISDTLKKHQFREETRQQVMDIWSNIGAKRGRRG